MRYQQDFPVVGYSVRNMYTYAPGSVHILRPRAFRILRPQGAMQKHDPNPTSASMLFCDIDGTLLQRVKGPGLFMEYWKGYANRKQTILVYNTGQPLEFVLQKVADGEQFPAMMVIANQGASIYDGDSLWSP